MRLACIALLSGCQFVHGALPALDDDAAITRDVPIADGPIDGAPPPYCDPSDPDLIACYPFEGSAQDTSGHDLHPTTANLTFAPGKVGMAMQFASNSAADVGENSAFDPPSLTIEAWIHPTALPGAGLRMGVVDNNGQYGLFLHEAGNLRCNMGVVISQTSGTIVAGQWNHVACTHDGSTTRLYAHGVVVAMATGGLPLGTAGTTGISIAADNPPGAGSRLVGMIDEVRMLRVARTEADVCRDAERTDCP